MDPQSPPKRMTRARAAKADSSLKSTKIVTPAAKAKTTRPVATASKRKTRSDDVDDDNNDELGQVEPAKRSTRTRGRPKKTVDSEQPGAETETEAEPHPAPARTRGRPKKAVEEPPKKEPTRATRATRARRAQAQAQEESPAEPDKKPSRARATSTLAKPAPRTGVKKTVKFEEPEKENIMPAAPPKGKAATKPSEPAVGLRAKPVRRPAAAPGKPLRTTKPATQKETQSEEKQEKPIPLSPKKVTQMALNHRETESEDELAADEKTPVRPRVRGPIRPPKALGRPEEFQPPTRPDDDGATTQTGPVIMLGSPCRRPPASPWKDSLKSPAKKLDSFPNLCQPNLGPDSQNTQSMKASLLQTPAKRPQSPIKGLNLQPTSTKQQPAASLFRNSLMSPAKRPFSPIKAFTPARKHDDLLGRTPVAKPTLLATPLPRQAAQETEPVPDEKQIEEFSAGEEEEAGPESPTRRGFPGRLSAVLPRHADPAFEDEDEDEEYEVAEKQETGFVSAVNGEQVEARGAQAAQDSVAPSALPPKYSGEMFNLRDKDLQSCHNADSDSEDELDAARLEHRHGAPSNFDVVPATPCPTSSSKTSQRYGTAKSNKSAGRGSVKRMRLDDEFGFTPLIHQLNGWKAGTSPTRSAYREPESPDVLSFANPQAEEQHRDEGVSPTGNTFFEDAIAASSGATSARAERNVEADVEAPWASEVLEPEFGDTPFTADDVALAREADEMSLMEPNQVDDHDDRLSDASQEYGDENAVPIDPALQRLAPRESPNVPPVTPQRTMRGDFHTVSKVPLKPADESTPRPKSKRRHSIFQLPSQRPAPGLSRNATVISYSPSKKGKGSSMEEEQHDTPRAQSVPPVTPTKSEAGWSTVGTPARTPRRDLDPALLRGAVVFVDVHTSEGADASGIFVELLGQMGARCVKSWPWNPSSPPGPDGAPPSSKIGITHVVYKDGGKRTLEKVRESCGVVQCVGVSWVLE